MSKKRKKRKRSPWAGKTDPYAKRSRKQRVRRGPGGNGRQNVGRLGLPHNIEGQDGSNVRVGESPSKYPPSSSLPAPPRKPKPLPPLPDEDFPPLEHMEPPILRLDNPS